MEDENFVFLFTSFLPSLFYIFPSSLFPSSFISVHIPKCTCPFTDLPLYSLTKFTDGTYSPLYPSKTKETKDKRINLESVVFTLLNGLCTMDT